MRQKKFIHGNVALKKDRAAQQNDAKHRRRLIPGKILRLAQIYDRF